MTRALDPNAKEFVPSAPAWNEPWAMPVIFSAVLTGLQGRWLDNYGVYYLVHGCEVHVTLDQGRRFSLVRLEESKGCLWWCNRWYVNEKMVQQSRRKAQLRWAPSSPQDPPLLWSWAD